jgi:hypothetical protein
LIESTCLGLDAVEVLNARCREEYVSLRFTDDLTDEDIDTIQRIKDEIMAEYEALQDGKEPRFGGQHRSFDEAGSKRIQNASKSHYHAAGN